MPNSPTKGRNRNNRHRASEKGHMSLEAATVHREDLMEATIAACALIALADGCVDPSERRRA